MMEQQVSNLMLLLQMVVLLLQGTQLHLAETTLLLGHSLQLRLLDYLLVLATALQ
jgi:hypothetical protein